MKRVLLILTLIGFVFGPLMPQTQAAGVKTTQAGKAHKKHKKHKHRKHHKKHHKHGKHGKKGKNRKRTA